MINRAARGTGSAGRTGAGLKPPVSDDARAARQGRGSLPWFWAGALALGAFGAATPAAGAAEFKFPDQTITVPDGFEVERVAGPPLVDRPMMADFDELGRLYVADSSGSNDPVQKQLETRPHRIVRLEDTDGDGTFDKSVVFADRLMFPEGVLYYDGAIYTGAPPTIWKLEDTDGDGVADRRTEWFQGKTLTGCANDLHGPYLGPDGWIYWCKGAFAPQTYERPGRRTISDSAAHVFRCRPDGSNFDSVMSGGMDNPVELAFTPTGDLFFITTFFHHPEAGKRDAIAHCIYGGVYPKVHGVLDGLQRTGELLPPLVELGPAAACGLLFYEGQGLGTEHEGRLFSTLFNLRKVMYHALEPVAGTYQSVNQDFLVSDNHDFHPTDVLEDADGSLLVIDTGGWYKICCPTSQLAKPDVLGAIYRVRRRGMTGIGDPRGLRLDWRTPSPQALAERLGDVRPAVRTRAIHQLAKQGRNALDALAAVLQRGLGSTARLNAVWALTRIDEPTARALVRSALADSQPPVQLAALHSVAMHRDRAALSALFTLLEQRGTAQQRKAAEALGRIGDKRAVLPLLEAAGALAGFKAPDPALRIQEHALIYALIEIGDRETTAPGLAARNPYTRRAALIALDQMDGGDLRASEVAPLLASGDPTLRATASWIAQRHPEWGADLVGVFRDALAGQPGIGKTGLDLKKQLATFARTPAIQELMATTLNDPATAAETRQEVLGAMAEAGVKDVPTGWQEVLARSVADPEEAVATAAMAAVRSLPLAKTNSAELSEALVRRAQDSTRPLPFRLAALGSVPGGLATLEPAMFELALAGLDPAEPPTARSASAGVLAKARLTEPQQLALAAALKRVGPMELNRLLEAFEGARSAAVGTALVGALRESPALASVRPDLLRQRLAQFPAPVPAAGAELLKTLDVDLDQQAARLEALLPQLKTGDIRRGQAIFNSSKTACSTCHTIGYVGGRVGPDLTSIGQIRTERDLLEAIVYPSASFVRSFEPIIVTTTDDEEFSGVVLNDTAEEIVLATGPEAQVRLAKAKVSAMRPGTVSTMPAGLADQLDKQELADLLAFLKATKPGAQ